MKSLYRIRYSFFFSDTATTEIYTLSLHDALPICLPQLLLWFNFFGLPVPVAGGAIGTGWLNGIQVDVSTFVDRKSTRLNSSHSQISYAVFCLKKKTC